MNIGIDPSGRAFRWQEGEGDIQTAYAVLGCPPYESHEGEKDLDEVMTWGNSKAFRPQLCMKTFSIGAGDDDPPGYTADLISVESLWSDLVKGENVWQQAILLADAVKAHCPAKQEQRRLAFAIPNRLAEDAQDALLRGLERDYRNVSLLWRPVAIMFDWLDAGDGRTCFEASEGGNAVWVLDLDSAGVELTRLRWQIGRAHV